MAALHMHSLYTTQFTVQPGKEIHHLVTHLDCPTLFVFVCPHRLIIQVDPSPTVPTREDSHTLIHEDQVVTRLQTPISAETAPDISPFQPPSPNSQVPFPGMGLHLPDHSPPTPPCHPTCTEAYHSLLASSQALPQCPHPSLCHLRSTDGKATCLSLFISPLDPRDTNMRLHPCQPKGHTTASPIPHHIHHWLRVHRPCLPAGLHTTYRRDSRL